MNAGEVAPELVLLSREPLNGETPLHLQEGVLTPVGRHYVRSHFAAPASVGPLVVDGLVHQQLALSPDELRAMPPVSLAVTLECAGNGRAFLDPPAPGEQWRLGAVATAEWTGVPLRAVLERARPSPEAREVVFRGADEGDVPDAGGRIAFERSLPLRDALEGEALLAYAMNGKPLPHAHGAPLRLVVPGAYGVASVKWLTRVTLVDRPFEGFYQRDRYVIDGRPLGPIAVRAIIVAPRDGAEVSPGPLTVRGYCWSGDDPVAGVEVRVASVGGGQVRAGGAPDGGAWREADLGPSVSRYAWREWRLACDLPRGGATLIARGRTASGARQPLEARRSALGYMNTAAQPVRVTVA